MGHFMHSHIGVCGDNLLLGRQLRALLEFEITDGTGQSQVSIDTAKVNEATRSTNASFLAYVRCEQRGLGPERNQH